MTLSKIDFAEYPPKLRARTADPSVTYELMTDRYALHYPRSERPVSAEAELVLRDDDRLIEILKGELAEATTDARIGPVYSMRPGGMSAVPTGLLFIRFKSGRTAAEKTRDIELAGYEITQVIDYAPEAAWVRHRSEDIGRALSEIPVLKKIPDVENLEPQMLMPRASK